MSPLADTLSPGTDAMYATDLRTITISSRRISERETVWTIGFDGATQFVRKSPECVLDVLDVLQASHPNADVFFTVR